MAGKYMKNKYVFVFVMLFSILVVSFGFTTIYVSQQEQNKDEEFVVVTSFYPMYIATMNVIGDTEGVTLKNLSEPQTGCLHDFQLTPADMKLLSTADVFIINGGGIESFMEEIAKQYPELVIIEACEGIELLCETNAHGHDDEETHVDIHETEVLSASSSASRVMRSRWFVGSSSISTLPRSEVTIANPSFAFSPPERADMGFTTSSSPRSNEPRIDLTLVCDSPFILHQSSSRTVLVGVRLAFSWS